MHFWQKCGFCQTLHRIAFSRWYSARPSNHCRNEDSKVDLQKKQNPTRPLHAECHYCFGAVHVYLAKSFRFARQPGQMKVEKKTTCQNCVRWMENETWSRSRIARAAHVMHVMAGVAAVPHQTWLLYNITTNCATPPCLSFAETILLRTLSHFGNELRSCAKRLSNYVLQTLIRNTTSHKIANNVIGRSFFVSVNTWA
jgi:hypothetical protein